MQSNAEVIRVAYAPGESFRGERAFFARLYVRQEARDASKRRRVSRSTLEGVVTERTGRWRPWDGFGIPTSDSRFGVGSARLFVSR